uniref:Uncharacterized protein n=1 Tax=Arundo donax TaxID=35708 RepID=A0A0A9G9H3_ARUDO
MTYQTHRCRARGCPIDGSASVQALPVAIRATWNCGA